MTFLASTLVTAVLAACTTALPSGAARGSAGPRMPVPVLVDEVRRRVRAHDVAGALALLETGGPLSAREPERAWLAVALWPAHCESERARQAARSMPPSDVATSLRALTDEEPARGLALLAAPPARTHPGWRALAAAQLHARRGDSAAALASAEAAARSRYDFVRQEAELMISGALRAAGELSAARLAAQRALAIDPGDARVRGALAEIHRRSERPDDAVLERLAAVRIAPHSEHYARQLGAQMLEGVSPHVRAAVSRALPPVAGNPELAAVAAWLAAHDGRLAEATTMMEGALEGGANAVPWDHHLRRWLVRRGAYAVAVRRLEAAVPPGVVDAPGNLRRGYWAALRAAVEAAPDHRAPAAARLALARAFVGVGALDEAAVVAAGVPGEEARALGARVRGHLAFEAALREQTEHGYRTAMRGEEPPSFETARARARTLARTHLAPRDRAAFARPDRAVRSIPILGAWLDHRVDSDSPTVRHFRRYGRFLLFGQQADGPPEVIVLSLASLERARRIRSAGRCYAHDVAIGYDRGLRPYLTAQGGGLGGACLADGIWLDVDAARRIELGMRRSIARDPAYASAVRSSDALAVNPADGPFSLGDPGCTAARLAARVFARHPGDPWCSFWTLQAHEFGHVADIRRHLPIVRGLPATLAAFADAGFSAQRVQMEFERRAQLGAAIDARDPDLALAEMLLALPVTAREPEVHDGGYATALAQIVRHLAAHPARYPQIDPRRRIVTQLDRLTNEQIRAAARAALR
jgi:tetratricopeptide (TPR) repeat protein